MAAVFREIRMAYFWIFKDLPDPRTKHFFLLESIPGLLCVTAAYVYFALSLGPKLMEKRKPFKVKPLMTIYNIFQILTCAYILIKSFPLFYKYDWICATIPAIGEDMTLEVEIAYIYYILKYVDLIDTVFFVLRKKQNQITFLHVVHHSGMVVCTWGGAKFLPGGETFYVLYFNSVVHFVMYIYYLVTGLNENSRKNVWWKKYLTQLQLTQFMALVVLFTLTLLQPGCQYRWEICMFIITQNLAFIVMFSHYYYQAFILKETKKTEKLS